MEDILAVTMPFVMVITIVWLVLHYKDRKRQHEAAKINVSAANNVQLMAIAERMERRIEALEQILDAEAPGWRKRHHEHS